MNNCTTMMNETATNNNTRDIIIYEEKSKKNYDSYEIFTKSGVQRIQFKLNEKPYMKNKIERKGFTITKEEIDYDRIEFSLAIQSDKRPFLGIIRIFKFHPLVKCFLEKTNQSRNILIANLILDICNDLSFNAFFYSDSYISDNYNNGYNYFSELPKSLIATSLNIVISFFLNLIIISYPSEEEINIKSKSNSNFVSGMLSTIKKTNLIFFILVFIICFFWWYFVSAFCGVYHNSQLNWFYGSLTSFAFSMIFPFIFALIASSIRKMSFILDS